MRGVWTMAAQTARGTNGIVHKDVRILDVTVGIFTGVSSLVDNQGGSGPWWIMPTARTL